MLNYTLMLFLFLIFSCTTFGYTAPICPDIKKAKPIILELGSIFEKEVCEKKKERVQLTNFANRVIPLMMNQDFLGVEPPPNWKNLFQDILANCDQKVDICSKIARKDIAVCITSRLPQILLVLGPWFANNCEKISDTIIKDWNNKKKTITGWFEGM